MRAALQPMPYLGVLQQVHAKIQECCKTLGDDGFHGLLWRIIIQACLCHVQHFEIPLLEEPGRKVVGHDKDLGILDQHSEADPNIQHLFQSL